MKPVRADFMVKVPPSPRLWLVALALLLGAVAAGAMALHQRQLLHEAQTALQRSLEQQRANNQEPLAVPAPKLYERSAREFLQERALLWPEALRALETTAMEGVTPRLFESNAADGAARVELVAASHAKVLEYLEALNAGTGHGGMELTWVLLQTQSEANGNSVVAVIAAKRSPAPR